MTLLRRIVCGIGAFVSLGLVILACISNGAPHLILTLLFLILVVSLAYLIFHSIPPLPHWGYLLIATVVCLIPRILAIWLFPVDVNPVHDFSTYYALAESFADGGYYVESSCNLFPHILFFSMALSVPFRLFGASILTYQICNLFLSLGTMFLLYALANRLFHRSVAFLATLFWALSPTLILYAPLNCHEHLCLFLLFLWLNLFFHYMEAPPRTWRGWLLPAALMGLILMLLNLIRPLAPIVLLTCLVWFILRKGWGKRIRLLPAALALLCFFSVLVGGKALVFQACDGIREEPLARSSFAFTLLAGSNVNAEGEWNFEDSKFFLETMKATYPDHYNYDAGYAIIMKQVKNRYAKMGLDGFLKLAVNKNAILWGRQKAVVDYLETFEDETQPSLFTDHPLTWLRHSCDAILSVLLLLMAYFCLRALWKTPSCPGPGLYGVIGTLGFVCMHTLTEAAGRYTVSAYPFLLLTAVSVLALFLPKKEETT